MSSPGLNKSRLGANGRLAIGGDCGQFFIPFLSCNFDVFFLRDILVKLHWIVFFLSKTNAMCGAI